MSKTKVKATDNTIVRNRKAHYNYELHEQFEAGVALQGWELKSLRIGQAQISESYVIVRENAAWILGSVINPLPNTTTNSALNPTCADRTRKLLLKKREIDKIAGALQAQGYSCVCLSLYWKKHLVKCKIALAKGRRAYDKRHAIRKREMEREQRQQVFSRSGGRRK